MTIVVSGLGTALPPGSLDQVDAASAADRLRQFEEGTAAEKRLQLLTILYRRSGVQKRHSVLLRAGDEHSIDRQTFYEPASERSQRGPSTALRMGRYEVEAPVLAEQSARAALTNAAVDAKEIRHLVTVSCSGFNSPGFDIELYTRLGLAADVSRTHVGFMGCHGALNGLRVAKALAVSHPGEKVLLCAVELCTLHHQYTDDPQEIVANSLFADGAAAAVIQSSNSTPNGQSAPNGEPAQNGKAAGSPAHWTIVDQSSVLLPNSQDMMSWRIDDHGFRMTLSAQVPDFIKQELRPWLETWLEKNGLSIEQVATWAVHPGGPRILLATGEALGLGDGALAMSTSVLQECGNMSSPTILFILERLLAQRAPGPCVALAFGPGLVVETALLS